MIRALIVAAALVFGANTAFAEEPIVGKWKTLDGDTAIISPCAGGYCMTLKDGKYAGRQIGQMRGSGNNYVGQITDPVANKTYSGSGTVTGNKIKMQGCALKVFCKSQTWTRL